MHTGRGISFTGVSAAADCSLHLITRKVKSANVSEPARVNAGDKL